jgi:hypothetical protein
MNTKALIGILLIIYGVAVAAIAFKKPTAIWQMAKIKWFIKVLGERGTEIFFFIFAAAACLGGLYLMLGF